MLQLVQDEVIDWIANPSGLAHLGWIALDRLLIGPSPFAGRGSLGWRQRANPAFDAGDFRGSKLAPHWHLWRKLALDELDQRTALGVTGNDGPSMLIAALNHRIERGHGESAGAQLVGMATGAVLLQQVFYRRGSSCGKKQN